MAAELTRAFNLYVELVLKIVKGSSLPGARVVVGAAVVAVELVSMASSSVVGGTTGAAGLKTGGKSWESLKRKSL